MSKIKNKPIRLMMLGLRGFPNVQGGVETHAEHLCPRLVNLGCDVEVLTRSSYARQSLEEWKGVRFKPLWSPKSKGMEAIVHTLLGVLYAAIKRPDVLHIQAIGPALCTPLARLFGLNVVVTHHGSDYDRQKWGAIAKTILKLGERFGMKYANSRIVISDTIRNIVFSKYDKEAHKIPNGVDLPVLPTSIETLREYGLSPGRYIIIVSRLVPEKRHFDLIQAYKKAGLKEWKLVIVGDSDHPDEYSEKVKHISRTEPGVICTGFLKGGALKQLYAHAGIFVLPSSHEGLPISLLEALSYGLITIASNIPANLEVGLADDHYFELGSQEELANRLKKWATRVVDSGDREARRVWISERYNWDEIADSTYNVYLNS